MRGPILLAAAAVSAAGATWDIQLAPKSEPGERLEVVGHVRKFMKDSAPLAGVHVYAYHADGKGYYVLPGHEKEPPRLAGTAITNAKGEYRIRTVLPGAYGGGPAHIHFEVWGPGMARRAFVMNLAAPQAARADTGSALDKALQRGQSDPALAGRYPVVRDAHGMLHAGFDMAWQYGVTIPGAK